MIVVEFLFGVVEIFNVSLKSNKNLWIVLKNLCLFFGLALPEGDNTVVFFCFPVIAWFCVCKSPEIAANLVLLKSSLVAVGIDRGCDCCWQYAGFGAGTGAGLGAGFGTGTGAAFEAGTGTGCGAGTGVGFSAGLEQVQELVSRQVLALNKVQALASA
jgi:hypothetical protein